MLRVHTAQPRGTQRNPARRFPILIVGLMNRYSGNANKGELFVSEKSWESLKARKPKKRLREGQLPVGAGDWTW